MLKNIQYSICFISQTFSPNISSMTGSVFTVDLARCVSRRCIVCSRRFLSWLSYGCSMYGVCTTRLTDSATGAQYDGEIGCSSFEYPWPSSECVSSRFNVILLWSLACSSASVSSSATSNKTCACGRLCDCEVPGVLTGETIERIGAS